MNREDSVLDEIDRLVDESLARGDQSDSFHGEQYRVEQSCPWCSDGWHFLPVTENMRRMRLGSYGRDEFGQGIVDPNYSYKDDTSEIICPGSEFHGPEHKTRTWDKQRRERVEATRPVRVAHGARPTPVRPSLPPGRRGRVRFIGPFERWTLTLEDERDIEELHRSDPHAYSRYSRREVGRRLNAIFELEGPVEVPRHQVPEWMGRNHDDVRSERLISETGIVQFLMKPVTVPFESFTVVGLESAEFPQYVEFVTSYDVVRRHPWMAEYWMSEDPRPPARDAYRDVICPDCGVRGVHIDCAIEPRQAAVYMSAMGNPAEFMPLGYMEEDGITFTSGRGHESDYVIIDESHTMNDERLRQAYVDEAERVTRRIGQEAGLPQAEIEALVQEGRSSVLRSGEEDLAERARRVAAEEQARAIQEAFSAAFHASVREAGEAGSTGQEEEPAGYDEHFRH